MQQARQQRLGALEAGREVQEEGLGHKVKEADLRTRWRACEAWDVESGSGSVRTLSRVDGKPSLPTPGSW